MERDSGTNFVVGFFFGALVGAAIGLLYAPKPGRETRDIMRHKADEATEKVREVASEARQKVAKQLHHEEAES